MYNDKLQHRRYVIISIMAAVVMIFLVRLFYIQILDSHYNDSADSNAFLKKYIYPPRGLIYDRNRTLLVYDKPAYDVTIIMREIQNLDTLALCKALDINMDFFKKRMAEIKKIRGYSSYTPQQFLIQLENREIADFQQLLSNFSGFYIQNRTFREYAFSGAAHVLGNIGEVSLQDIDKDSYYSMGDYAGRDGIEKTYEKTLRGIKGEEILLRDSKGRIKGKYKDGEKDISPKAGENITLSLDITLQMLGEELMSGKIGSIVAIEPQSGEILAMVTNPGYDPSLLVGRQRSKNYNALLNNPAKPLINRAVQAQYSPGSAFKTLEALVCQQLGGITQNSYLPCNGQASVPVACSHSHGSPVSLLSAIEQSCNPYFWNAFRATVEKDGYGKDNAAFRKNYMIWQQMVKSFGLGERFADSDVFEQARGYIPSEDLYNKIYGRSSWRAITVRSLSIGQGEILTTPLQMANFMCSIANNGYYITPHLLKNDTMLTKVHRSGVEEKYFPIVKEAMWRVFESGTAAASKLPGVDMCGKTGTVDNNHGKPHSFFVGFAPRENPKIAICVVVENAGYGGTFAAPIFSLIAEQYLKGTIERTDMKNRVANTVTNVNLLKTNN
jgi:penicillin-binding protein 2